VQGRHVNAYDCLMTRVATDSTDTPPDPAAAVPDTRERILRAALRLFRKHGYHGVGINDILALAQAPKGSMYHHFPGGKEAIGVAVVELITRGLLDLLAQQRAGAVGAATAVRRMGAQLTVAVERTQHELCALFAAFAAERSQAPALAEAVRLAYQQISQQVVQMLRAQGWPAREARDTAALVVMLIEGGSMLSAAQGDVQALKLAVRHAAQLCERALP
jgi:TetR/AcrR family transcriptional regulator, lmrAB and yxaGH operons repressor